MKNRQLSSKEVYKAILKEIASYSEEELLSSEGYYNLLDRLIQGSLKPGECVRGHFQSSYDNTTGYTDGDSIHVNTFSPIILEIPNEIEFLNNVNKPNWASQLPDEISSLRYEQYLANVGTTIHECGHVLYTDFDLLNKMRNDFTKGIFKDAVNEERLDDIYHSPFGKALVSCFCDMVNIVEDGYIENCLVLDYPPSGTVVRGLAAGNRIKFFMSSPLDELEKGIEDREYLLPQIFVWLIQIKNVLGYTPKNFEKCSGEVHDILKEALDKSQLIVDDYIKTPNNHKKDLWEIADIIASLFPDHDSLEDARDFADVLKQMAEEMMEQESQQSNGDSSDNKQTDSNPDGKNENESGNENQQENESAINKQQVPSDDDFKKSQEKLEKDSGVSKEASGFGSAQRKSSNVNKTEEEKQKAQKQADKVKEEGKAKISKDDFSKLAKELAEEIAKEKIASLQNDVLKKAMEADVKDIDRSNDYGNADIEYVKPQIGNKHDYLTYLNKNKSIINATVRKISQLLKKRDYDESENGFLIGSQIDVNSLTRDDKAFFKRNITPDTNPDVCFSIMIDQSGSMSGKKIKKAKEVAVIMNEISQKLDIPTRVVGHTEFSLNATVYNYKNFESTYDQTMSLAQIEAGGGNFDSFVLAGLCNELLERNEKHKVLIVISDGYPCGPYADVNEKFKNIPVKNEIKDCCSRLLNAIVRYYRKKGIKIIGISIDCFEDIQTIYEDGTLDCTDLNKLPIEMTKIFKKYVLK